MWFQIQRRRRHHERPCRTLDPVDRDTALDAVVAAPKHHKVLFENEQPACARGDARARDEEPVDHHRWPSVFVLDQVDGPVHDIAPDGAAAAPKPGRDASDRGVERPRLPRRQYGAPAGGPRPQRLGQDDSRRPRRDEEDRLARRVWLHVTSLFQTGGGDPTRGALREAPSQNAVVPRQLRARPAPLTPILRDGRGRRNAVRTHTGIFLAQA